MNCVLREQDVVMVENSGQYLLLKSLELKDQVYHYMIKLKENQDNPEIIFADEPTGSLDSDTGIEIMELLKELNKQGKTIIMVTHDEDLTKYASKVIKLKDGLIMEEV